jgi:hypothetical protein
VSLVGPQSPREFQLARRSMVVEEVAGAVARPHRLAVAVAVAAEASILRSGLRPPPTKSPLLVVRPCPNSSLLPLPAHPDRLAALHLRRPTAQLRCEMDSLGTATAARYPVETVGVVAPAGRTVLRGTDTDDKMTSAQLRQVFVPVMCPAKATHVLMASTDGLSSL